MESVEPGQDYEVVIDFIPDNFFNLQSFYNGLEKIGTSNPGGEGDGMYRMHIHVPLDKRYEPIDYTMTLGKITKVAMENLQAQMESNPDKNAQISIAPIEPGQNCCGYCFSWAGHLSHFFQPGSSRHCRRWANHESQHREIISAFKDLPTDKVIILPNNKNIVMAAQTAASTINDKRSLSYPAVAFPRG